MRKILIICSSIIAFILLLSACSSVGNGELVGVERKAWYTQDPYGMVIVPPGSFVMGPSDQDVPNAMTAQAKTVTVQAFWMDETEISNSEYRQFIYWVRDSLALTVLGREKSETEFGSINPKNQLTENDFILDLEQKDVSEAEVAFTEEVYGDAFSFEGADGNQRNFLDWGAPLNYDDFEIKGILAKNEIPNNFNQALFLAPPAEVYHFRKTLDLNTDALYYSYYKTDLNQAAKKRAFRVSEDGVEQSAVISFDRLKDRGIRIGRHFNPETGNYEGQIDDYEKLEDEAPYDFAKRDIKNYSIKTDEGRRGGRYGYDMRYKVAVYPDTLCWMSDYTYSYNEPMTKMYFWHPAYDNYPVVGVSWIQADAFCQWRTNYKNAYQTSTGEQILNTYRLPSEVEWEYASRGGLPMSMYPWGGEYTRNYSGCFIANFKPMRGNYYDDGGVQTLMVASYDPNEWGLYDMAGNVAEWTADAFDASAYSITHDLNPSYQYNAHPDDFPEKKRKVVRGGSWKDVAYYMQNGTRTYEYQDSARSYIGFRCVRTYLGRHRSDGASYSKVK